MIRAKEKRKKKSIERMVLTMYSRKPMTILTSRMEQNASRKAVRKAFADAKEFEMTSPAFGNANSVYANIGGVVIPVK